MTQTVPPPWPSVVMRAGDGIVSTSVGFVEEDRREAVHPLAEPAGGVGQVDLDAHRAVGGHLDVREPGDFALELLTGQGVEPDHGLVAAIDERHVAIGNVEHDAHQVRSRHGQDGWSLAARRLGDEAAAVEVALGDEAVIGRDDLEVLGEQGGAGLLGLGDAELGAGDAEVGPGLVHLGDGLGQPAAGGLDGREGDLLVGDGGLVVLLLLILDPLVDDLAI